MYLWTGATLEERVLADGIARDPLEAGLLGASVALAEAAVTLVVGRTRTAQRAVQSVAAVDARRTLETRIGYVGALGLFNLASLTILKI